MGKRHERIAQLKLPTLILWGEQDRLITPACAKRFHLDIAGSELVFEGLGHVPHEEEPMVTVGKVRGLL